MQKFFNILRADSNATDFLDLWTDDKLKLNSHGISEVQLYGVSGSLKHSLVAMAYDNTPKPVVIITPTGETIGAWREDLASLLPAADIYELPAVDDHMPPDSGTGIINRSLERSARRMDILGKLRRGERIIVLSTMHSALQKGISNAEYQRMSLELTLGKELKRELLLERLVMLGYEAVPEVEHIGEFSFRGGIVDVFPQNLLSPLRIEFFDNEIDSIRHYDIDTKRSLGNIGEAIIMPLALQVAEDKREAFLGYLDKRSVIIIDEPRRLQEEERNILEEDNMLKGKLLNYEEFINASQSVGARIFYFSLMMRTVAGSELTGSIGVQMTAMTSFARQFNLLASELKRYQKQQTKVAILLSNEERAEAVKELLSLEGLTAKIVGANTKLKPDNIPLLIGGLRAGFELITGKIAIITEYNIFGRHKVKPRKKSVAGGDRIKSFHEIKLGDYVVHNIHGIGKYIGVETIEVAGIRRDYLQLKYGGDDKLFVPTDQVSMLHKYMGAEGKIPKLHRMGSTDWIKAKARAQKSIEDIADKLIALYADRQLAQGHAFAPDDSGQREFEEAFPYEETPDQLQALVEIKKDMESRRPMDRLLCGDVGFGKTEVAIRAAYKAAMDGYQVAVLVPTTVLAQQHYQTFTQRFKDFAPKIDVICRFRSPKEQIRTLAQVAQGRVDILIGTHAILNNNRVSFKRLGLLIVDEEQRFGVKQKEKIKELAHGVDVLTLSATPIPRTLHMSLAGARDMSIIETPPADRLPVQSYVVESSDAVIKSAIEREIMRGGQVYFIYNSIQRIDRMHDHLMSLVPEARIGTAHGQMNEDMLESVMMDFYEGHYDVLLATSIVENGLDVANANTIIVYDADKFGLSQLYQMRGRVGRSARMAFAYFTYRRDKVLTEMAEKRLQAMREFVALGAGFKIAMRDLEIRGAGSILGAQQHGHIDGVGFEMYVKLLEEAVALKKGEPVTLPQPEPFIDLPVEAYLEADYINDPMHKIEIYQKIARVVSNEEIDELLDEMIDRFGDPPLTVLALLDVARLKLKATAIKAKTINSKFSGKLTWLDIIMLPNNKLSMEAMLRLNKAYGKDVSLLAEGGYRFNLHISGGNDILKQALAIMELIVAEEDKND